MSIGTKNAILVWMTYFLILGFTQNGIGQYTIQGKLNDSKNRYSAVTLEYLPSIRGLTSTVMGNIINRIEIDSSGYFSIKGNTLPKDNRLYRLSVMKKKHGASISDGIWKNFILLELNNESQIEIEECDDISINFGNCVLSGNVESQLIQGFYDQVRQPYLDDRYEMAKDKTRRKEQFLNHKYVNDLKTYCDTSNYLIPSLIAFAHIENMDNELKEDPNFFKKYLKKIKNLSPDSPYVVELENEITTAQEIHFGRSTDYSKTIILLLGGCLLLLGGYTIYIKRKLSSLGRSISKEPVDDFKKKLSSLSKKEMEVYQLIIEGKSNKEIASVLFVETTTVKSHISKIYQKLSVKNRKEAILKWPKNGV